MQNTTVQQLFRVPARKYPYEDNFCPTIKKKFFLEEIFYFDKLKVLKSSMTIVFSSSCLKIAKKGIFSAKFEVLSNYIKLFMNLNFRAEKQGYCLTSLNCVITIVFSVSCIKQKNYFFKKMFIFLVFTIVFSFTKIFVFNDSQFTESEK